MYAGRRPGRCGWQVLCLGVIFLQVMLDNKINSEEDVAKYLELTIVGVIPEYEGGKKK
ncbi:MAG: hypothetical protein PUF92_08890 [Subdoligranulum variabile]|nr:hypothetical protein [Subdoligranulum variabile]MDD6425568.1 hypothetical protein [Subdoligranulum variabile]